MVHNFKLGVAIVLLSLSVVIHAKSLENSEDIVWFPNPNGDGSLIPAKLTPTPGAMQGDISDIHFRLYTKENPEVSQELELGNVDSITNSNFVDGAPVKFMVHGFGGGYDHAFPWKSKNEYVTAGSEDVNVILLDWEPLSASPDYFAAVANAQIASKHSADLLNFLVAEGKTKLDNVHLIGYSLGGQVVGQIGNRLEGQVSRITALDPALPLFDVAHPDNRTSPDDAGFVDVIHTAANGILGFWDPIGHVDWYPNGGRYQPGCGLDVTGACAHSRAPAMFAESVWGAVKFIGRQCATYEEFKAGTCNSNPTKEMGHHTAHDTTGIFFLDSNDKSPFAKGPL